MAALSYGLSPDIVNGGDFWLLMDWLRLLLLLLLWKTDVTIMYINGIARNEIIEEVRRLKRIDIDGVRESSFIEQLIEDQTNTTFPTIRKKQDNNRGKMPTKKYVILIFLNKK